MPIGAMLPTVIGAGVQAIGAASAGRRQEQAGRDQIAAQEAARAEMRGDLAPWRTSGGIGLQAYLSELGLADRPMIGGTLPQIEEFMVPGAAGAPGAGGMGAPGMSAGGGTMRFRVGGQDFATREEAQAFAAANPVGGREFGGFTKTPGYDFRLGQGISAIESSAAARGGLYSGATMRDALKFGQDYATSEYTPYLNRLAGLADTGQSAAAMSGNASMSAAANIGNALGNIGNARAAGAIGVGNAINSGINNLIGINAYQQQIGQQPNAPRTTWTPSRNWM